MDSTAKSGVTSQSNSRVCIVLHDAIGIGLFMVKVHPSKIKKRREGAEATYSVDQALLLLQLQTQRQSRAACFGVDVVVAGERSVG